MEKAASRAGISEDQARRAAQWLKSKGLITVQIDRKIHLTLGDEGRRAISEGLPERRVVKAFRGRKKLPLARIREGFRGRPEEFSPALGHAKQKGWIEIRKEGNETVVHLRRRAGAPQEEAVLRILRKGRHQGDLPARMQEAVEPLARRQGYIVKKPISVTTLSITPEGRRAAKEGEEPREVDRVTPAILASGSWRTLQLRPLDVEAPAPVIHPGKKHPLQRFIDEVTEIFVSLGFQEIEGPIVQPSFWNFDALFIPQDHSARDMQDTFYLSNLTLDDVGNGDIVPAVATVHENGGSTGSKGWGYLWRPEEARRLVLRTHTTPVTVKYLADHKPSEARVFTVGRVFRNEKVTFKNLVEFHQIEGITVGQNMSLRDLMGLLTRFYQRLGLEKVKFWPTFFPYTEPSLQSVVYMEKIHRWVELCGMGLFRPEVTLPLGVSHPVLAWGGGLERLVMLRYGLEDARSLYENNLRWLRDVTLCQ